MPNDLIEIARIRRDGGTQPRRRTLDNAVDEYAEAMANGDDFPPVDVYFDGTDYWLADGFHRVLAAIKLQQGHILANVHQGTVRDAKLHAAGANTTHGIRRFKDEMVGWIEEFLEDPEWGQRSNVWLASQCKVSDEFVRKIRQNWLSKRPLLVATATQLQMETTAEAAKPLGNAKPPAENHFQHVGSDFSTATTAAASATGQDHRVAYTNRWGRESFMQTGKIGRRDAPLQEPTPPAAPQPPAREDLDDEAYSNRFSPRARSDAAELDAAAEADHGDRWVFGGKAGPTIIKHSRDDYHLAPAPQTDPDGLEAKRQAAFAAAAERNRRRDWDLPTSPTIPAEGGKSLVDLVAEEDARAPIDELREILRDLDSVQALTLVAIARYIKTQGVDGEVLAFVRRIEDA